MEFRQLLLDEWNKLLISMYNIPEYWCEVNNQPPHIFLKIDNIWTIRIKLLSQLF